MSTDRFKFRVWCNPLLGSSGYLTNRTDLAIIQDGELMFDSYDGLQEFDPNGDDCIVEQCTGLKDADGKLIYEGDIICGKNPEVCHEIVFDHERACFRAELLPKPKHWMQNSLYCGLSRQWIDEFSKRIVGNIHENPELLKEEAK